MFYESKFIFHSTSNNLAVKYWISSRKKRFRVYTSSAKRRKIFSFSHFQFVSCESVNFGVMNQRSHLWSIWVEVNECDLIRVDYLFKSRLIVMKKDWGRKWGRRRVVWFAWLRGKFVRNDENWFFSGKFMNFLFE